MRITKENIEAFWLDHLEGNLAAEQAAELLLFLENNPAIKLDLEEMGDVKLTPQNAINSADQSHLKVPMEAAEIDELLAKKLEGDLTPKETKQIDALIASNPAIRKDWELISLTVLGAESAAFDHKSELIIPASVDYTLQENLAVGKAEGDLDAKQEKAFDTASKKNAQLVQDVALYKTVQIKPQQNIVYPNKADLKRSAKLVAFWPVLRGIAVAASLIAAAWVFWPTTQVGQRIATKIPINLTLDVLDEMPATIQDQAQSATDIDQLADLTLPEKEEQKANGKNNSQAPVAKVKNQSQGQDQFAQTTDKKEMPEQQGGNSPEEMRPLVPTELPQEDEVAVVVPQLEHNEILEEAIAFENTSNRKEYTPVEFVGKKALGAMGIEDAPDKNIGWELLDKAAEKLSNEQDSRASIDVEKPGKKGKGWKIKIGNLEVGRI